MRRIFVFSALAFVAFSLFSQNDFSLLPDNMINFIGKINQAEFEIHVGEPVGYEENFVVYEITNTYDKEVTALRCGYRPSDGKLVSVKFPTSKYMGYWLGFSSLKGFDSNKHQVINRDPSNYITGIKLKLNTFGCQMFDFQRWGSSTTVVVNYHTVKQN